MARLDQERQKKLEQSRIEYSVKCIQDLGYKIEYQDKRVVKFTFKNKLVTLFPYSGWHTGKTIIDGRGLNNLINQIQ